MSLSKPVKKFDSVSKKTFDKWSFKRDFTVKETDDDGNVINLQCIVCAQNLHDIRLEAGRRGIKETVLNGIVNYANGITYVHKGNIVRHIKADGLHSWAKQTFSGETSGSHGDSSTASGTSSSTNTIFRNTPKINKVLDTQTRTCYKNLFSTVLYIVANEKPFADLTNLVDLQRKNGVKFINGKDSNKLCRELVGFLAKAIHSHIESILHRANFISAEMDGSQARKTGEEKELIYIKVVVNGLPVELMLRCQSMAEFGGEDANSIKESFDSAFTTSFNLPLDRYEKLLVSVCCDGASVNMGTVKGACTLLKQDGRMWMLAIHCSNHRLELAIKDAFTLNKAFQEVDELMCQIYYMFRNSGKAKRIFIQIALTLGVTCVSFVKASGTRFQNHKYRAGKAMIINFLPLCVYIENMIENKGACKAELSAKLKGYLSKFLSYSYLASLHFYVQTLSETAHLAYIMQSRCCLITDLIEAIRTAKEKLSVLADSTVHLPFAENINDDGTVTINAKATNLPASITFREKHKLSAAQNKKIEKLTHVSQQEYKVSHVVQGRQTVNKIKETLLPVISHAIDKRFAPFLSDEEIYTAMLLSDDTVWDYDDNNYGIDKIQKLSQHFEEPLSFHGFNIDLAIREFKDMKLLVGQKYRSFQNKFSLWKTLFDHFSSKYPNILLLIELCLSMAWSSSTVERGFSTCRRILTDSRTSLNKDSLNDLLLLRINVPVMLQLEPMYEVKLVDKAVELYMQASTKGRYTSKKLSQQGSLHVQHSQSASNVDSFLPTPFKSSIENALLSDNSHLAVSDSDNDSDSNADSQSNSDDDCTVVAAGSTLTQTEPVPDSHESPVLVESDEETDEYDHDMDI